MAVTTENTVGVAHSIMHAFTTENAAGEYLNSLHFFIIFLFMEIASANYWQFFLNVLLPSRREGFPAVSNVKCEGVSGFDYRSQQFNRCIVRTMKFPENFLLIMTIFFFSVLYVYVCVHEHVLCSCLSKLLGVLNVKWSNYCRESPKNGRGKHEESLFLLRPLIKSITC